MMTLVVDIGRFLDFDKANFVTGIGWCLTRSAQYGRRSGTVLNARDEVEARGDPIEFTGDVPLGPPFGWALLWRGVYSNIYGKYVPDTVKEWGYVMWDRGRWDGLGDLVWRQWETAEDLVHQIESDFGWRPWG